jgi:hypothetical protein
MSDPYGTVVPTTTKGKKMAKMADTQVTDTVYLNDCVVCDARAAAEAAGKKGWSVSTAGQPLCRECYDFRLEEMGY